MYNDVRSGKLLRILGDKVMIFINIYGILSVLKKMINRCFVEENKWNTYR
jgi:hypothetical protein